MTGLERVRDYIGKYAPNPTKAMHVLEDLDAHEKEDAEKAADALAVEGQLHEKWTELEAEVSKWKMRCLTRDGECIKLSVELGGLREELDLKDGLLNQAKGELDRLRKELERSRQDDSEWKATIERTNAENARLREDARDMEQRLRREADKECARLRKAPCDLHTELREENARLREAVEDYFEHDDIRPLYDVYQERKS